MTAFEYTTIVEQKCVRNLRFVSGGRGLLVKRLSLGKPPYRVPIITEPGNSSLLNGTGLDIASESSVAIGNIVCSITDGFRGAPVLTTMKTQQRDEQWAMRRYLPHKIQWAHYNCRDNCSY
jgi:hypothetical protein